MLNQVSTALHARTHHFVVKLQVSHVTASHLAQQSSGDETFNFCRCGSDGSKKNKVLSFTAGTEQELEEE